jgi:integrase
VDFARDTITVLKRHSKNKREYSVPMNEAARDALLALRESAGDCPWVFVNPATGVSLTEIKRAFTGALADAGINDFRFHDPRRRLSQC